jgi:hypothetical protein
MLVVPFGFGMCSIKNFISASEVLFFLRIRG